MPDAALGWLIIVQRTDGTPEIYNVAIANEREAIAVRGVVPDICHEPLSIVMPSSSVAPYVEADGCLSKR